MKNEWKAKIVFIFAILLYTASFAQTQVSGTVVDTNNMPLGGATVLEKGTTNGTSTDFDGNFSISVQNQNATLEISYIGFATQGIALNGRTKITVVLLENAQGLDEVVVTALGIERQEKKIGYSTQKMSAETINEVSVPNTANLFTGQVAGLVVNNRTGLFQSPEISLRGGTPLIVVDGIIISSDMYDISPNDIADMNVLKGETASALYGSRASSGAIIITTKNPNEEGLNISVNHNTMVSAGWTVFPEFQKEYGNGSQGKYEFWDGKDGGISDGDMIWGPKFEPGVLVKQWNSPIRDKQTGEVIPWWGDVSGTQYDDKARYERVATPWKYHDNLKDFMETGVISSTDFSINQRSENGYYRLSGNFKSHKGRVPNSSLKTGGLTFKSRTNITDDLTLDAKLALNKVYTPNYPRHGYGPRNHMYTLLVWMGDDVNGEDLKNHMYIPGQEGYRQANFNYAWYNNVYFAANELNQEYDKNVINALMKLKYQFTDNLSLQLRGSAIQSNLFEDRESPKSYLNYGDPREGDYKTWNTKNLTVDYDALLNYNKSFSKDLAIDINVGASSYYNQYQQEYNATDGLVAPWIYSLNNSAGGIKGHTRLYKEAINAVYGTVSVDLFDAVYLNFTGRNDWNSTLPAQNRSYFYPSASLSTVVSNLVTMPEAINLLKVKASWAKVSKGFDPYSVNPTYYNAGYFADNPTVAYPNTIFNQDLKPEHKATTEFGIVTSMFNNRLGLDVTYYNSKRSENIINEPISLASGFSSKRNNAHEFTRKGAEIVLSANPYKTEKFKWDVLVNWSTSAERLTRLDNNANTYGNLQLDDRSDSHFAKVWEKSADGQLVIDATTGLPNSRIDAAVYQGHRDPSWRLGLQNKFKMGKFLVNIGIDGVWGGIIRSKTVEKMWWGGKHPNSTKYRDAEYAAGNPVYVPEGVNVVSGSLTYDPFGNVISDTREYQKNTTAVNWQSWSQTYPYRAAVLQSDDSFFANIFDRSFFKLRTLQITYDFTDMVKIKGMKKFTATLSGYNLLAWKKADIIDPDFGNDDSLQDPSTRYIGLGVNMKF
ncbi:MAG: SusC/RagA family TonB-linked outer membrane protein [Flavobacteriaceae bacterium]|nr:SusC/RagA family TonB-linked outer membrane protein [Flavobacteriaceae bacterium]